MDKRTKEAFREQGANLAFLEFIGNKVMGEMYKTFKEMMKEMEIGYRLKRTALELELKRKEEKHV